MAAIPQRQPLKNHLYSPSLDEEESDGDGEGECPSDEQESDDSEEDPTFDISAPSKISLRKSRRKPRRKRERDRKCFQLVEKFIKDGQLEKLKVDQCKLYLRKHGLRLTGKKDTLIDRIREHLEIQGGGGEKKYPISSFVVDCKGDACIGDVVMFEQKVYEMQIIASRNDAGPPLGKRLVAGRIVKESYGEAKQQHTFTIEVLWSKGEKPLSPLHQLLIKGRKLYRHKTLRQRWDDEAQRRPVLQEKHARGSLARYHRKNRIQKKEIRRIGRSNRMKDNKSSDVIKGEGTHNQRNACLPAVLRPPQHHPKAQNSVEVQVTEQATGTLVHMNTSKLRGQGIDSIIHMNTSKLRGQGIESQCNACLPAVLNPPQHHLKTQNSVEVQVIGQATGTHIRMITSEPITDYRENSVQQSKLQRGQLPQPSLSIVNSRVLQQGTNIIDNRSESRFEQLPLTEKHSKYPQGHEQFSSQTDELLHDHAKHHRHLYRSQEKAKHHRHLYHSQERAKHHRRSYHSQKRAKHCRHPYHSQERAKHRHHPYQSKFSQGHEQYSYAKHHHHWCHSHERVYSYNRQSKCLQGHEKSSSSTDKLLNYYRKNHRHRYQSKQGINSYDRQPCRYYRRRWFYFGEQHKYLHEYQWI